MSVLVLVASLAACENKPVSTSNTTPAQAAQPVDLPENPLLAFAPADTPYAFASFKPLPPELFRKLLATAGPIWRQVLTGYVEQASAAETERQMAKDVLDVFEQLDLKKLEEYGFSASARFVAYGLGAYPVFRAELNNGDRVFETVQSVAARWNQKLPAPLERGGRRYWIVDLAPKFSIFAALAPKELVFAIAPRATIDGSLAALLGEQRAAKPLTTAQFRTIASRDGYTGYGVGFLDVARVGAMVVDALGAPADCAGAVAQLARRAPRLTAGYGELSARGMDSGMVIELAPDLLADLRKLAGSLSGLDALLAGKQKPAMAFALAADLDQGRAILGRVAVAMQDLGRRCGSQELVDGWVPVADVAGRPLPPYLAGARGGYLVVNDFKMGPAGPSQIDAVGALLHDRAAELVKLAEGQLPDFKLPVDGKAHALPASVPFPGHLAASERAIGLALGPNSQAAAVKVLSGKPAPAPLALFAFDYARLADIIPATTPGVETEAIRNLFRSFGLATFKLLVDARGVVMWTSFELR